MSSLAAIVLAAGQGTRMRSRLPKVLHPLAGRPMIGHVLALLAAADAAPVVVVTGHGADAVEAEIGDEAPTVRQEPQRGTADAVRVALPAVPDTVTQVIVTMADVPLLPAEIISEVVREQADTGAVIVLLQG